MHACTHARRSGPTKEQPGDEAAGQSKDRIGLVPVWKGLVVHCDRAGGAVHPKGMVSSRASAAPMPSDGPGNSAATL